MTAAAPIKTRRNDINSGSLWLLTSLIPVRSTKRSGLPPVERAGYFDMVIRIPLAGDLPFSRCPADPPIIRQRPDEACQGKE
jgi:hypothetical protein